MDNNVPNDVYQLNENVKEYTTNDVNENDFEAHVKYIDIHYLIIGKERISCVPLEKVELKIPYSSDNDIAFYKYATTIFVTVSWDVVISFPQDAHMP